MQFPMRADGKSFFRALTVPAKLSVRMPAGFHEGLLFRGSLPEPAAGSFKSLGALIRGVSKQPNDASGGNGCQIYLVFKAKAVLFISDEAVGKGQSAAGQESYKSRFADSTEQAVYRRRRYVMLRIAYFRT
jgi:hypothetical protein